MKKEENKIFVLLTTCNRPNLLKTRALKSIQLQTAIIDQVIIVDDSCEDYIKENKIIINGYNKLFNLTYIMNKRTSGVCGAMNTGIEWIVENYSNHNNIYLAVLDDDDEWKENYLYSCYKKVRKNKYIDWVGTDFYRIENEDNNELLIEAPDDVHSSMFLIGNPGIQGSNLFIRLSKILEAGCFDEHQGSSNDRDMCIRLCDLNDLVYTRNTNASMIHYAESDRMRYSNPSTKLKNQGLYNFWVKHCGRMSHEQKEKLIKRTEKLFNWNPYDNNHDYENESKYSKKSFLNYSKQQECFSLLIGVIACDKYKAKKLISSLYLLTQSNILKHIHIIVLCNGINLNSVKSVVNSSSKKKVSIEFIEVNDIKLDDSNCVVGKMSQKESEGPVSIAKARTILQKYMGTIGKRDVNTISWVLDEDMRIDSRALNYIPWLYEFKKIKTDVLIGSIEGISPNTVINGIRVLLVDIYHNLHWLKNLDPNNPLPNRCGENNMQRIKYPDYYYDLSSKHTGHLESPHWIEPYHSSEKVFEAYQRLLNEIPLILSGHPLTRTVYSPEIAGNPIDYASSSVNRGGNTFIFNSQALLNVPNLTLRINGRDSRRSDMIWAILNKHIYKLKILYVPFPVLHDGYVRHDPFISLQKYIDECIGVIIYKALSDFLKDNKGHSLRFTNSDMIDIWDLVKTNRKKRLTLIYLNFIRIMGLIKSIENIVCEIKIKFFIFQIKQLFSIENYELIKSNVMTINYKHVERFLLSINSHTINDRNNNI